MTYFAKSRLAQPSLATRAVQAFVSRYLHRYELIEEPLVAEA